MPSASTLTPCIQVSCCHIVGFAFDKIAFAQITRNSKGLLPIIYRQQALIGGLSNSLLNIDRLFEVTSDEMSFFVPVPKLTP